jgi:hypothetical protein
MSAEAVEFIEIFEALPVEKKVEVTDFARFLFERLEDDRWEKLVRGCDLKGAEDGESLQFKF